MTLNFHRKKPKLFLAACFAAAVLFSLGIRFVHLERDFKETHKLYFFENNLPLMTTLDAYFYLRIAKIASSEGPYSHYSATSLPLLSVIPAAIHDATGAQLEKIAFYLPPLLSCLMILIYFWWGREFGGNTFFFACGAHRNGQLLLVFPNVPRPF